MSKDNNNGYHLLSVYDVPGIMLDPLHTGALYNFHKNHYLVWQLFYLYFTVEETKSQRELSKLLKLSNESVT